MRREFTIAVIVIVPLAVLAAVFRADGSLGRRSAGQSYVVSVSLPQGAEAGQPKIYGPADAGRPLVVLDPGHGGKDPGAKGANIQEKELTLAVGLALRDALVEAGGVRVALTREDDRLIPLTERAAIGRRLGADLFISLHADSTPADSGASGATVYTLSERGSTEIAERMAARENAADQINGIAVSEQAGSVSAILVDLSQRDALARSEEFASLVLREGQGKLAFKDRSRQSAAFVVLKAPDMPSVLFEMGYINNPEDVARLATAKGRAQFAGFMAQAIKAFLARQAANEPGR